MVAAHFALWDNECLDDHPTCAADGRIGRRFGSLEVAQGWKRFKCIHCAGLFDLPANEA
jgi:hypothetical protein